ncbi:MAG: exodeoxyribonuclease VII small subunit [Gemmatimonadetes bacterium]|nr:exodeoxyribonuclease VII small subunit [Gemmatimonadota bacterium]
MPERTAAGLDQRLRRLDEIVAELEREDLEIEAALALFEEGIAELRAAERTIREAELRIERLIEGPEGVQVEPLRPPEGG